MEQDTKLHTLEDIRAYLKEDTAKQNALWRENYGHILRAKNAIWLLLLVIVFLQVYMINVMIEAASLESRSLVNPSSVRLIGCQPPTARL